MKQDTVQPFGAAPFSFFLRNFQWFRADFFHDLQNFFCIWNVDDAHYHLGLVVIHHPEGKVS